MNTKNIRFLLIPLALLAVIILAACTPSTPTPDANAPMNQGTSGEMMGNSQGQDDMMGGQSEEEMMGESTEEEMMGGQSKENMMGESQNMVLPKNADGFTDISVAQLEDMLKNKNFALVNVHHIVRATIDARSPAKAAQYARRGFVHYHELVRADDWDASKTLTYHPTKVVWLKHIAVDSFNLDGGPHPEFGHQVTPAWIGRSFPMA